MLARKLLITICLVLIARLTGLSYDFAAKNFEGDVIYYNLISKNDKTVEVTGNNNYNHYKGDIVIPAFVEYNGETYTVVGLGMKSMRNCPELESLILPESIEYIDYKALKDSGLKYLSLPSSLKRVGHNGFGLSGLQDIYLHNSNPYSISFTDERIYINPECTIHVPIGCYDKYKSHPIWGKYKIDASLIR